MEAASITASSVGDNVYVGERTSDQRLSTEQVAKASVIVQNNTLSTCKESPVKQVKGESFLYSNIISDTGTSSDEYSRKHLEDSSQGQRLMHGIAVPPSSHHAVDHRREGQQLQKKKCYLFQHKRSTLYNSLCNSENVFEQRDSVLNCGLNKGNSNNNSNNGNNAEVSGSRQASFNSVVFANKKAENEATSNTSDNNAVEKKSTGISKRSYSKTKIINTAFQRTIQNRPQKQNAEMLNKAASSKSIRDRSKLAKDRLKRPRGRPRKSSMSGHVIFGSFEMPVTVKSAQRDISSRPHSPLSNSLKFHSLAAMRQKYVKAKKNAFVEKSRKSEKMSWAASDSTKKAVLEDDDLSALLKSVRSSVKSQFMNEDSDNLILDDPFKVIHPVSAPKLMRSGSQNLVKPKAKKPKLHVMMRRTKRKKRKKPHKDNHEITNAVVAQKKLDVFGTALPPKNFDKFTQYVQEPTELLSMWGPEKTISDFTPNVQPPKIISALNTLNDFHSSAGLDGLLQSSSSTDIDQSDWSDKKGKKRHQLLYRKSKHKNIVDPVFAAHLDSLVSGFSGLAICENPADNFIRVRPGEVPLPSIFRVTKIDLNKKIKERTLSSEGYGIDKSKLLKSRKGTSPVELSSALRTYKGGRKKSYFDQPVDHLDHIFFSDSGNQFLPPKKRHRLVNLEASSPPVNSSGDEAGVLKKDLKLLTWSRTGRYARRSSGAEERKQAQGKLAHQRFDQELTIDTSSFTTGESNLCASSLSPCPSKLSAISSALPSWSSPSPTGSSISRNRYHSKSHSALECSVNSVSSCLDDQFSCAECRLLERSASPSAFLSCRATMRTLSVQASECSCSPEWPASSSEPSPVPKEVFPLESLPNRNICKRRKSSAVFTNDSDSPPSKLESNTFSLADPHHYGSIFSESQELAQPPQKKHMPSRQHSLDRTSSNVLELLVIPSSPHRKKCSRTTLQGNQKSSSSATSVQLACDRQQFFEQMMSSQNYSRSEVHSCSEYEPLPLEHCKNREMVEEILAATVSDSNDDNHREDAHRSSSDHEVSSSSVFSISSQPPRKRFQRVGLFSNFYKDEEPRKRESIVKCRDKLAYVKKEHEFGLMPQPLHIGQYYMRQLTDFQLPYDIWWMHNHNQLPKKQEPKIKFRTIRTNVYSDNKVSSRKLEIPCCSCTPHESDGKGCGDDCLNRVIYTECSPLICSVGENCGNQKIQRHEWAQGLEKFLTDDRGFGIRTKNFIRNGQFILEYLGEIVSETEFRRRMMEEYSTECHHYALHLDSGSLIDGYRMGNIGRYVNHSCQPNCEMQKWNVNGLYRMGLFALRDIQPDEELTYDYNFDSFNQESQQECHCGSLQCRGVIGVKTQRISSICKLPEKVMDDAKDKRKNKLMNKKLKEKIPPGMAVVQPPAKPMSLKERCYARRHRTFLVRNVDKIRNQRNTGQDYAGVENEEVNVIDCSRINVFNSDLIQAASCERTNKTRLASYAKDDPEMTRRHQLSQIFEKIITELLSLKDEDGWNLVGPLMSLPSTKKQPDYYEVVKDPIDLSMIKQRVKAGSYGHLSSFNSDIMLLFSNVELYCGIKSEMGQIVEELRQAFDNIKANMAGQIDELLGSNTTKAFMDSHAGSQKLVSYEEESDEAEEDIIRCICGMTRDEGLMLQCEKCLRWQHCDCVQASGNEDHYLCDQCQPRYYDPEILLVPQPRDARPNCTHYLTLVKDDIQYALGDCVYVMRDNKRTSSGTPVRSSHRLMVSTNPDKMDVYRLEQLWKDTKGEKYASGTPYLRPQETFHEPTRKFYHNELFRTPNFEVIPMEFVVSKCVVMDPGTYIKGRPKGFREQDVYICEYRVDKTAHLFYKIQKIRYPINTGKFCFDRYDTKLKIKRTFLPHAVPEEYKRKTEPKTTAASSLSMEALSQKKKQDSKKAHKHLALAGMVTVDKCIKNDLKLKAEVKVHVNKGGVHNNIDYQKACNQEQMIVEILKKEKKQRLDKILSKLLRSLPGKQKIDLTYLLDEGRRSRKKVMK